MFPHRWLNANVAARLAGVELSVVLRAAKKGRYGPTVRRDQTTFISSRGIELSTCHLITEEQLALAMHGCSIATCLVLPTKLKRTPQAELCAEVARTKHYPLPEEGYI